MLRREFLSGLVAMALRRDRLDQAVALLEKAAASGEVGAAALDVTQGEFVFRRAFGKARSEDEVFLLASITKPMTAAAVMRLVERGRLSLADPVRKFIPEFAGGDRALVTVKHLLTHTSGLPDMLPEDTELRNRNAPLKEFVERACKTPLLFKPGTEVRYQSMGILLAAEIAERITKTPFRDFLKREIFDPLGMKSAALGLGSHTIEGTARSQVSGNDHWNWNSPYWRNLGAPWGGAHASAADVRRFLNTFLYNDGRILKPETAAAMIVDQNTGLNEPRGIGFVVKPGSFGKACSARAFGHSGSTGTIAWADPETKVTCVLLTTRPAAESRATIIRPVCDIVSESAG
ncbi:MAG: serine hydrolase domain-containing protein [Bryobacteraceae bacterium]